MKIHKILKTVAYSNGEIVFKKGQFVKEAENKKDLPAKLFTGTAEEVVDKVMKHFDDIENAINALSFEKNIDTDLTDEQKKVAKEAMKMLQKKNKPGDEGKSAEKKDSKEDDKKDKEEKKDNKKEESVVTCMQSYPKTILRSYKLSSGLEYDKFYTFIERNADSIYHSINDEVKYREILEVAGKDIDKAIEMINEYYPVTKKKVFESHLFASIKIKENIRVFLEDVKDIVIFDKGNEYEICNESEYLREREILEAEKINESVSEIENVEIHPDFIPALEGLTQKLKAATLIEEEEKTIKYYSEIKKLFEKKKILEYMNKYYISDDYDKWVSNGKDVVWSELKDKDILDELEVKGVETNSWNHQFQGDSIYIQPKNSPEMQMILHKKEGNKVYLVRKS